MMMKLYLISIVSLALTIYTPSNVTAENPQSILHSGNIIVAEASSPQEDEGVNDEDFDDFEEEETTIYDPIEPFNRAMFVFNDKLYFWVLKPVAQGYNRIVPEKGRTGVSRFFSNITTPIRFVNSLLQFKFKDAGIELSRFVINTTIGVAGFMDPARKRWNLNKHREDLGQTIGFYGAGPAFYITWPVFGPSSVRDTVGMVGDFFLNPVSYLFPHDRWGVSAVRAYDKVNETSLNIGFYEGIKKDALDPYTFIRDAYHQHRESLIK